MTRKSWDTLEGSSDEPSVPSAAKPRIALPQGAPEAEPTWEDELEALRTCLDALAPLSFERQRRILGAVQCMLDGDCAVEVLRRWTAAREFAERKAGTGE